MEPRDQREPDPHQGSDPPRDGKYAAGDGGPEAPQVIGTDAPLIASGPASRPDWADHPDRNLVVQTSRIREPNQAFTPNFIMVPVESGQPPRDRSGAGYGGERVDEGEQEKGPKGRAGPEAQGQKAQPGSRGDHNGARDRSGERPQDERGRTAQAPSLTRIGLFSGIVALVCGIAGAWGYSYFFGPDKSKDQKSSGKESGAGKGGGSSPSSGGGQSSGGGEAGTSEEKGADTGKLVESQTAWLAAVKELNQARQAEKAARGSEEEKRAVLDFLKNTLLSAGRPGDKSLSEAFWKAGQGKDVTLRQALDAAESQVTEAFADRPLAEAATRELLGLGYVNVGEASRAVRQYERALALREAALGPGHADTAACRNQLAVAYRLAGREAEAGRLFERTPDSSAHAAALAVRGSILLHQRRPAEAELALRESLTIRRKIQPEDWTTFETESIIGEALVDQKKFADAEPLLLSGYEGMRQREAAIPPQDKPRLTKALERLVRLYEAWGNEEKAARWRAELQVVEAPRKP